MCIFSGKYGAQAHVPIEEGTHSIHGTHSFPGKNQRYHVLGMGCLPVDNAALFLFGAFQRRKSFEALELGEEERAGYTVWTLRTIEALRFFWGATRGRRGIKEH